jgi:hypothetical protein
VNLVWDNHHICGGNWFQDHTQINDVVEQHLIQHKDAWRDDKEFNLTCLELILTTTKQQAFHTLVETNQINKHIFIPHLYKK